MGDGWIMFFLFFFIILKLWEGNPNDPHSTESSLYRTRVAKSGLIFISYHSHHRKHKGVNESVVSGKGRIDENKSILTMGLVS